MTVADIQCLKDHIDKLVEIRTVDEECLIARVQIVTHCDEYDEYEVTYEVVSSNQIDSYAHLDVAGGYVLDFGKVVSVEPVLSLTPNP